jgi:hypothetical protein
MKGSMYKSTKHSIKEDRRLRDRPAKFITPGQASVSGNFRRDLFIKIMVLKDAIAQFKVHWPTALDGYGKPLYK